MQLMPEVAPREISPSFSNQMLPSSKPMGFSGMGLMSAVPCVDLKAVVIAADWPDTQNEVSSEAASHSSYHGSVFTPKDAQGRFFETSICRLKDRLSKGFQI